MSAHGITSAGVVLQTDEDRPKKPDTMTDAEWQKFTDRTVFEDLYFDWQVLDE